jgi:hypothetical protein
MFGFLKKASDSVHNFFDKNGTGTQFLKKVGDIGNMITENLNKGSSIANGLATTLENHNLQPEISNALRNTANTLNNLTNFSLKGTQIADRTYNLLQKPKNQVNFATDIPQVFY